MYKHMTHQNELMSSGPTVIAAGIYLDQIRSVLYELGCQHDVRTLENGSIFSMTSSLERAKIITADQSKICVDLHRAENPVDIDLLRRAHHLLANLECLIDEVMQPS
jgi:hypothetical protein